MIEPYPASRSRSVSASRSSGTSRSSAGPALDDEHVHQVGRERDEARLAAHAHERVERVLLRGLREVVPPDHLARVLGLRRVPKDAAADERVDPVGTDHEVVAAAAAVRERDVHPVVVLLEGVDGHAERHLGTGLPHRVLEDAVEPRPRDAVHAGEAVAEQRRRGHRTEHVPFAVSEAGPLDRESLLDRPFAETELVERTDRVSGLDDPDPVDVPFRVELDDVDVDARVPQGDGAGQPADPAADHENAIDAHQVNSPVAAFVSSAVSAAISTGGNDSNIECGSPRFL